MPSFQQQLKKVSAFFKPESLAKQTLKYEGEIALLVIDVQRRYCDPVGHRGTTETAIAAERIQSLAPEFKKAGVPVYNIYYCPEDEEHDPAYAFYKYTPGKGDALIRKTSDSAFESSDIDSILKKDKKKLLIACGFNLSACVRQTLLDARDNGFDVCLLRDLSDDGLHMTEEQDDNSYAQLITKSIGEMQKAGIAIENSATVLHQLRRRMNLSA